MKVLVTGGAGFIGSWLVRTLLTDSSNIEVINLDLLTYAGNLDNLADIADNPRYRFVHGDIRDVALVNELMQEVDACIHLAAETHVDRSITGPLVFTQTNVMGTHILLEAARVHGLKKFVLVSTDEVYGSLPLDTPELFTEKTPLKPNSPYAASKASADLLAMCYFKTYGMPVCITRCGNNYGPYQYPEKLIPFFILKALSGESVPVYGDGLNVRDWIYVEDHAKGIWQVCQQGQPGEVYNIGASEQHNNLEMTRLLLQLLGQPESSMHFVADRPGHDRRYALDTAKIQTNLGWKPEHSFESALRQTVAWYQQNSTWIQRVQARQAQEKVAPGAAWLVNESL
jgi:dTDP-glucose 4,6-dehydratase